VSEDGAAVGVLRVRRMVCCRLPQLVIQLWWQWQFQAEAQGEVGAGD
jgi:hypothetical protein